MFLFFILFPRVLGKKDHPSTASHTWISLITGVDTLAGPVATGQRSFTATMSGVPIFSTMACLLCLFGINTTHILTTRYKFETLVFLNTLVLYEVENIEPRTKILFSFNILDFN